MSGPALSVVIPTRDRCGLLGETLAALDALPALAGGLEVVVVDDGSSDDTGARLGSLRPAHFELRWLKQAALGPAAARNRGVEAATAPRVLLLGDDTVPWPEALALHAEPGEIGRQGRIDWDPERPVTPVMRFLAPSGPQFYFDGLADGQRLSYAAVLSSNCSLPRRWLLEERFDERFTIAGFEDTELAYRFERRGFATEFRAAAGCWHRHHYESLEPFLARQRRVGQAARLAVRLHPTMLPRTVLQPALTGAAFALRAVLRRLAGKGRSEELWDLRCRWAFIRGFLAGGTAAKRSVR